jgi:hypothetical protein
MAINQSKKMDQRAWNNWHRSGAIGPLEPLLLFASPNADLNLNAKNYTLMRGNGETEKISLNETASIPSIRKRGVRIMIVGDRNLLERFNSVMKDKSISSEEKIKFMKDFESALLRNKSSMHCGISFRNAGERKTSDMLGYSLDFSIAAQEVLQMKRTGKPLE